MTVLPPVGPPMSPWQPLAEALLLITVVAGGGWLLEALLRKLR